MSMQGKILLASAVLVALSGLQCQALAKKSTDWDKKLKKGYYELSIGRVDKATKIFRGKVKRYPDSGACHTALGKALKKRGKLVEAKQEFKTATSVDPGYAEGFYELGAMLEKDKDFAPAAAAFESFLKLSPDGARSATVKDRLRYCKENL